MKKTLFLISAIFAASFMVSADAKAQDDNPLALGKRTFNKCVACHIVEEGRDSLPNKSNLWGIFGREAGTSEGFRLYSNAMKESRIVWDTENMDAYLENPRRALPGTSMNFFGVRSDERRAQLIEYMKQITGSAE